MNNMIDFSILDNLSKCVLIVLGINTVRDVIAWTGWVPRSWKYSHLFYGRFEDGIVDVTLERIGFDKKKMIRAAIRHNHEEDGIHEPLMELIHLIGKCIQINQDTVRYGRLTPVTSNFYINTMDAVHCQDKLDWMCRLMMSLVIRHLSGPAPRFIVCPKDGNPILGVHFARKAKALTIFRKGKVEPSRVSLNCLNDQSSINFEGINALIAEARQNRENGRERLTGIAIDCNASGGSNLLSSVSDFNAVCTNHDLHIEPVRQAFILFRPDNSVDIDKVFREAGIGLVRYFDLDEKTKALIARNKWGERTEILSQAVAKRILSKMMKERLIHW